MTEYKDRQSLTVPRGWVYTVLGWLLASLVTASVGPFGTFAEMPPSGRFVYWASLIGIALVLGNGIRRVVLLRTKKDGIRTDLIGSCLMSVIFGALITLYNVVTQLGGAFRWADFFLNASVVLLVSLGITLLRAYMRSVAAEVTAAGSDTKSDDSPDAVSDEDARLPAFLEEIDPAIARGVHWIEADDHYLRVHAANGSARVLMRFRDALEELAHLPGIRIHRSHWVKIEAVQEVRVDGRRHVAVLPCGSEVPVSRTYVDDLREAGLIGDDAAWAPPPEVSREGSRAHSRP